MANNTRALQHKANSGEFDQKLADIKRLIGFLEKIVNEVLTLRTPLRPREWNLIEASDDMDGCVRTSLRYLVRDDVWSEKVSFVTHAAEIRLDKDSQFTLEIVRRLHDNLDAFISCAERLCTDARRLAEFRTKMARFGM